MLTTSSPLFPGPGLLAVVMSVALLPDAQLVAQAARVTETTRSLKTYPFSEPNPVPMLTRDTRLYPYHSFEGYAVEGVPRDWKVVTLENDLIEVFVLPQAGGKVWGAVVKATGHEFIYRNEVMKFRNIALRGPWTSGGIEFNFGVIGHTPSTATPVDYVLRNNPDGSASVVVGTMDLPSRTHWRVEIRLPPDKAYFETRVLWYNPTTLEQPYYNWMTAAAFARDDLVMSIPGNVFLEHSGAERAWPVNDAGRYLPGYANNTFAGHKSYHVVGELNDFFGGYYQEDDYGFGHWSRYEEMPGQKLWLWALSREGGVWEDLLTDTDGQYVEYQAGRLFVQYSPADDVNPITQAGFEPGATDRWSETWFPLEGTGGLTDASREGAMHIRHEDGTLRVSINAFSAVTDTLRITSMGNTVATVPVAFKPVEPVHRSFVLAPGAAYRVELRGLGLDYSSDPAGRTLARPFSTEPAARPSLSPADRDVFDGRELMRARRYGQARERFAAALEDQPWHREALLGMAGLEYRRGLYQAGLRHARRALQLDGYDAEANFVAGNLYRALGRIADARGAFGWAARSMAFRSAAYVQLAELALVGGGAGDAGRYARLALDFNQANIAALQIRAMIARQSGDEAAAGALRAQLLAIDPLQHFVAAEEFLAGPTGDHDALFSQMRSEYPDQTILELAIDYQRRGARADAVRLLRAGERAADNPLLGLWRAFLEQDPSGVVPPARLDLVFPYRPETATVLEWALQQQPHWSLSYLRSLNLWALDREQDAAGGIRDLPDEADYAPAWATRAQLPGASPPERDLRRAVALDPASRILRVYLVQYLQSQARWEPALAASAAGRERFPEDFNLDLLHARSLMNLGRANEAVEIMSAVRVLPSESGRESHRLYAEAHLLAALDALASGGPGDAAAHARAALEWPERLGQGRPYEPDERLAHYLLGLALSEGGDVNAARSEFTEVLSPVGAGREIARLDLLGIAALHRLDTPGLAAGAVDEASDTGRLAAGMLSEMAAGRDPGRLVMRVADQYPGVFAGIEGRILLRVLTRVP